MSSPRCAVVFDIGAYQTRIGLSRDATPSTFPTLVSKADSDDVMGSEARSTNTRKIRPVYEQVEDWGCMEKIYEHAFKLVGAEPQTHAVLLNRSYPFRYQDEKITQIMFETFNVPGLYLNFSAVLALHGQGATTGFVVDSGFCATQFYPIYEGHVLQRGVIRGLPIGGDYLTCFLEQKLRKKKCFCDYETANTIKETKLYISIDLAKEEARDETLVINDQTIRLSTETYLVPEELFHSSIEWAGLPEIIFNTLYRCDASLRQILCENILLTGGSAMIPGLAPRLEQELKKSLPNNKFMPNCHPKVEVCRNPQNSVWLGGAKIANQPAFGDMCMTLQEYDEYGPGLIHTKFF